MTPIDMILHCPKCHAQHVDEPDEDETCWECDQPFHLCECHVGADCGRWRNGHLSSSCSKAGSEECDFECPHRDSLYAHGAGVPVASKTSDGEPS